MRCGAPHLEERARRELARLLGEEIAEIPRSEEAQRAWTRRIGERF
jgi:hypothetical protein